MRICVMIHVIFSRNIHEDMCHDVIYVIRVTLPYINMSYLTGGRAAVVGHPTSTGFTADVFYC